MNKKFTRVVCVILALLMLFGVLFGVLGSVAALAVSQSEIDELEEERDEIRAKQADVQEQLDALQSDMTFILDKKAVLDEQNELKRQDIELIDEQIALYDEMIAEKAEQVEEAQTLCETQYARFCERLRAMEENSNGMWYLSYLFQASSFSDFLARLDDIREVTQRDYNLEKEYLAARDSLQAAKEEYEAVQAEQLAKKEELESEKADLEAEIEAAAAMIKDLEADIDEYTAFYEENEALEAEVQAKIDEKAAELAAQEAAKKAAEEAARQATAAASASTAATTSGTVSSSSSTGFTWPCPSSTYITSKFGYRVHPIFNTTKFHSGVDIAANAGSNILAAKSGTVSIAEYSSSYGNYVVIYHSDGTSTLYAHMSSMAVSAGQTVSAGELIGYVGSTGNSTGPHLHFEVRVNGTCVDPLSYFTWMSLSYASDA